MQPLLVRFLAMVLVALALGCSASLPNAQLTSSSGATATSTSDRAGTAQAIAATAQDRARALPTRDSADLFARLDVVWASGEWAEALALLDELERLDPTMLDYQEKRYVAHFQAGLDLAKKGNTVGAVDQFARADSIDPSRPEAKAALAALAAGESPAAPVASGSESAPPASQSVPGGRWLDAALGVLRQYDRQYGTILAPAAERSGVTARAMPPGVYGAFLFTSRRIYLNAALASESPDAIATVLSHEAQHAIDVAKYGLPRTSVACQNFELTAFKVESGVWMMLNGPGGKEAPASALEADLNQMLVLLRTEPDRAVRDLTDRYEDQCG